jgi:serine protease Do
MKRFFSTLFISGCTALISLYVYDQYQEKNQPVYGPMTNPIHVVPTNFNAINPETLETDFTGAAEKTVNAVVHVKNTSLSRQPSNT